MELRHLRYFIAVAKEENVSRAAARLHVAQPAVSRQVRDLEEALGVALLERTPKSVRLTEAGRAFLVEARAVLQRAEEAVAKVRAVAQGEGGDFQVGYAPSLTAQILPQALRRFQALRPGVRVLLQDLSSVEMVEGLRKGSIHIALTVRLPVPAMEGLRFVPLAEYSQGVALSPSHPLAGLPSIRREQLVDLPLVGYCRQGFPEYAQSISRLLDRDVTFAEEHDSATSLIAAVEAERGVAVVPSCLGCLAGSRLVIVPLEPPLAPVVVGALHRSGQMHPATDWFISAAKPASSS